MIITGSWLTVKEQMAHHYATALAERGYTVFTFDFAGFGQSGGSPRQAELPARKIADITTATQQVAALSYVEPGRVGHLAKHAVVVCPRRYGYSSVAAVSRFPLCCLSGAGVAALTGSCQGRMSKTR